MMDTFRSIVGKNDLNEAVNESSCGLNLRKSCFHRITSYVPHMMMGSLIFVLGG